MSVLDNINSNIDENPLTPITDLGKTSQFTDNAEKLYYDKANEEIDHKYGMKLDILKEKNMILIDRMSYTRTIPNTTRKATTKRQ